VQEKAKAFRKHAGYIKREDRKQYVKAKSDDKKASAPRVSHSSGSPPASSGEKPAKDLEEAWTRRVAAMYPDAP
jgi:hypothetical protein